MAQVGAAYLDLDFVYAPPQSVSSVASRRLAQYLGVSNRDCVERLRDLKLYLPPLYVIISRDMTDFDFSVKWANNPSRAAIYSNQAEAAAMMFPTVAPYVGRHQARIGPGPRRESAPFVCTPLCAAHQLDARPTFCCAAHAPPGGCQCARTHCHPSGRAAPSNAAWLVCQARLSDSETELSVSEAGGSETMRTGRSLRRGCRKRP